jgi:hypothetical protein
MKLGKPGIDLSAFCLLTPPPSRAARNFFSQEGALPSLRYIARSAPWT